MDVTARSSAGGQALCLMQLQTFLSGFLNNQQIDLLYYE